MFSHSLVQAILSGALLGMLLAGARWLLSRGGAPTTEDEVVVYRPRPGVRVLALLFLLGGLSVCGYAVVLTLAGDGRDAFWVLLFALFLLLLAAMLVLPRVTLDSKGLRHQRSLLKPIYVPWQDLSHYEINGSSIVSILLLRSRTGTTVALSNRAFDVNDLLRRAVQRTGIQRQPYKRQSWLRP